MLKDTIIFKIYKYPLFQTLLTITYKYFATNRYLVVWNKCVQNFSSFGWIVFWATFKKLSLSGGAVQYFKMNLTLEFQKFGCLQFLN